MWKKSSVWKIYKNEMFLKKADLEEETGKAPENRLQLMNCCCVSCWYRLTQFNTDAAVCVVNLRTFPSFPSLLHERSISPRSSGAYGKWCLLTAAGIICRLYLNIWSEPLSFSLTSVWPWTRFSSFRNRTRKFWFQSGSLLQWWPLTLWLEDIIIFLLPPPLSWQEPECDSAKHTHTVVTPLAASPLLWLADSRRPSIFRSILFHFFPSGSTGGGSAAALWGYCGFSWRWEPFTQQQWSILTITHTLSVSQSNVILIDFHKESSNSSTGTDWWSDPFLFQTVVVFIQIFTYCWYYDVKILHYM